MPKGSPNLMTSEKPFNLGETEYPYRTLEKLAFFLFFGVVLAGIYFSHTGPSYYENRWAYQDGPIKWLILLGLGIGVLLNLYRAWILEPFREKRFMGGLYFFSFLFSLVFMAKFLEAPRMMEWVFHLLLGGTALFYLIILPLLYRKKIAVQVWVDSIALPLPKIYHLVIAFLLWGLCEILEHERKGEMLQLTACWIFLLTFFEPYNRQIFSRSLTKH